MKKFFEYFFVLLILSPLFPGFVGFFSGEHLIYSIMAPMIFVSVFGLGGLRKLNA